jgi:epoxyqueuosine reductase
MSDLSIAPDVLKTWLKSRALELGFDDIGFADASKTTPHGKAFLHYMEEGRHGPLDYMERTQDVRADIQNFLPGARSVIMLVKNYFRGHHEDSATQPAEQGAKVARYAWGKDYHNWFKKRLRKLRIEFLQKAGANADARVFCDTSPVLERSWAAAAGLGFIGKSNLFIHRRYGTWTFLGGMVCNQAFAPDKPAPTSLCGSCTACLDACPTGALIGPRQLDARKCLTTWNVERPWLQDADAFDGHGWAVGCDICQEVCPWNKFENLTNEPHFDPLPGHQFLTTQTVPSDANALIGTPLLRPGRHGLLKIVERTRIKIETR